MIGARSEALLADLKSKGGVWFFGRGNSASHRSLYGPVPRNRPFFWPRGR